MTKLILLLDDIRSAHNVGSILRTSDGLGVAQVILCGITPYPAGQNDSRLPYLAEKITKQINKTALGAENFVTWSYSQDIRNTMAELKSQGYEIVALEQTDKAKDIKNFKVPQKIALVVGNEVEGVSQKVLDLCDAAVQIPMAGKKESLNVAVASSIASFLLLNGA